MQQDLTANRSPLGLSDSQPAAPKPSLARRAWEGWKRIAHKIGVVQTRIIMVVFYFLFMLPLGLVLRLVRDPLHFKHPQGTNWVPHQQEPNTLENAQRQF